ncbi:MAG: zinc ribbon domain-containing protein [Chloroflexota bacterium]|nr:zinc ribbon domain-containing protein [Chloroflexota bacterium]
MPIYEYQCEECGHNFEKLIRSMSSTPDIECPKCHSANCKKAISLFGTSSSGSAGSSAAACAPSG